MREAVKKILGAFKNLPPELRMLLVFAGLATPMAAVYVLRTKFFPNLSLFKVVLIVLAAGAVVFVFAYFVYWLFSRGAKKRQRQMAYQFADESTAGPAAMDVRAVSKANNEKFFNAIRDMRKNAGLSVYDLPWYIVIGDAGCGKTKLVNEGGLTFSTGKPEGYQLGTLNYNWWFSEDAIFIDMAGRLCNPRDDADRREWESFLSTVSRGRKGFPINGALVCVSAEHLLQDSPERIEQDANTMLERLRDLQTKLGVTFATYLIVTKCDKILGFMPFFERADRDITVKNQIFGWSKPGAFSELYDPEQFSADMDKLFARLHDLRLRRLSEDSDEMDLGMVYGFPEEWRQLEPGLQTYVRTLFPMIKNPRAVRNLVFRGLYFTSATQEGSLILKHLTERLGADAASQFEPLDLYPNKRPHFIKDLLFRKVFPEHGLVFRNEQHVVRNQQLARLLRFGSVAMVLLLVGTWWVAVSRFNKLAAGPREHVKEVANGACPQLKNQKTVEEESLNLFGRLDEDRKSLQKNRRWAWLLSWGVDPDRPVQLLEQIQSDLFHDCVLSAAVRDAETGLATKVPPADAAGSDVFAKKYLQALAQYVAWPYAVVDGTLPGSSPSSVNAEGLADLAAVVMNKESVVFHENFRSHAVTFFGLLNTGTRSLANTLGKEGGIPKAGTIDTGLTNAHGYFRGFATLSADHPDATVREWARIHDSCSHLTDAYNKLLPLPHAGGKGIKTQDEFLSFQKGFAEQYKRFTDAAGGLRWTLPASGGVVRIGWLRDATRKQHQHWWVYQNRLEKSYMQVSRAANDPSLQRIKDFSPCGNAAEPPGLDTVLFQSLRDKVLVEGVCAAGMFDNDLKDLVKEVPDRFRHLIRLKPAEGAAGNDSFEKMASLLEVERVLAHVEGQVRPSGLQSVTGNVAAWTQVLLNGLGRLDCPEGRPKQELEVPWKQEELKKFVDESCGISGRGVMTQSLTIMDTQLSKLGNWGFAELDPQWCDMVDSVYTMEKPCMAAAAPTTAPPPRVESEKAASRPALPSFSSPTTNTPVPVPVPQPGPRKAEGSIPLCATQKFLGDRAEESVQLQYLLNRCTEENYFAPSSGGPALHKQCAASVADAWQKCAQSYAQAWAAAYDKMTPVALKELYTQSKDWPDFAAQFTDRAGRRAEKVREASTTQRTALAEILKHTRWATYRQDKGDYWSNLFNVTGAPQEGREIADAVEQALQRQPSLAECMHAEDVRGVTKNPVTPWDDLATDFKDKLEELQDAIGRNAQIPNDFRSKAANPKVTEIKWGQIGASAHKAGLQGEKLTGELLEFERRAQHFLDMELTKQLYGVQEKFFDRQASNSGWPYRNTEGNVPNPLQTVPFSSFRDFLDEVERAHKVFEPLEKGFPQGEENYETRHQFYGHCEQWRVFIGGERSTTATPLMVDIKVIGLNEGAAGKQVVQNSPVLYYDAFEFNAGLKVDSASDGPLRVSTAAEDQIKIHKAKWHWDGKSDKECTFSLTKGRESKINQGSRYLEVTVPLGKLSELAFMAYLQHYGAPDGDRRNWVVSHGIELNKELAKEKPQLAKEFTPNQSYGEKLRFTLDRELPEPIVPLKPR